MHGVSLFAGIGGFDLAMQRAGIETVCTVEIDATDHGGEQWLRSTWTPSAA